MVLARYARRALEALIDSMGEEFVALSHPPWSRSGRTSGLNSAHARQKPMKMGYGMWILILGILALIVGGAMEAASYHKTIGLGGIGLGVILVIIGIAWWMMKDGKAPKTAAPQPTQPAKTP